MSDRQTPKFGVALDLPIYYFTFHVECNLQSTNIVRCSYESFVRHTTNQFLSPRLQHHPLEPLRKVSCINAVTQFNCCLKVSLTMAAP